MERDLGILQCILRAMETGRHEEFRAYEGELRALYSKLKEGRGSESGLREILRRDPKLITKTVMLNAEETLSFVREQVEHYSEIKRNRPLSESEKRFGREELAPILSKLKEMIDKLCP